MRHEHVNAGALQNPTLSILPAELRHDVWLVENDIYDSLSDDPTPMLASFAPECTFGVSGLLKAVTAGLRGGWVACPAGSINRIGSSGR